MQISLILAALETWAPIAVILFVMAVYVLLSRHWPAASQRREQIERFDRWLRAKQTRSPIRLWIEIIAMGVTLALLAILLDRWLASPVTLKSVLIWGTWV